MARVVMPLAADFEDSEFRQPYNALIADGHEVVILGEETGKQIKGKRGVEVAIIQTTPHDVRPDEFDAMVIPGGYSPDHLRIDEEVVDFVRKFDTLRRPIAAVCHGPQLLIEADVVRGRTLTSWPSVKKDLQNAGALWVDLRVCEDGHLITSRKPDDLEAFSRALLSRLAA
jgi:protease I